MESIFEKVMIILKVPVCNKLKIGKIAYSILTVLVSQAGEIKTKFKTKAKSLHLFSFYCPSQLVTAEKPVRWDTDIHRLKYNQLHTGLGCLTCMWSLNYLQNPKYLFLPHNRSSNQAVYQRVKCRNIIDTMVEVCERFTWTSQRSRWTVERKWNREEERNMESRGRSINKKPKSCLELAHWQWLQQWPGFSE